MERALERLSVTETLLESKEKEIQDLKEKLNERKANKDVISMMLSTVLSELDEDAGGWFGEETNLSKINRLQALIANLKSKKNQAESVADMKSNFLANMSHEIRTPMNGIMGLTKLLLNTELSDKQNEYLRAVESSSDTLLVIINDILDISKIEAGKLSLESSDFLFVNLLSSVIGVFEGKAAEKGINLVANYHEGDLPEVLVGDAVRLNQILYNLMSNAVKFTHEGEVSLRVDVLRRNDTYATIQFTVTDTGIGMDEEQQAKVFNAFSQANSSTTRKFGGTGLGLSIVKQLVELKGGEIIVKSELGKGSSFSFDLVAPIKKLVDSDLNSLNNLESVNLEGVNVLLVEDNPVNQLVASDLLTEVGVEVQIANNGQEALDLFDVSKHDIVLMDIQMPVMDGYTAISKMRGIGYKVPVIALTAHITETEMERCKKAGANDYLSKPYKPQELYKRIAGLLKVDAVKQIEETNIEELTDIKQPPEKKMWNEAFLLDYVGGSEKIKKRILDKIVSEIPVDTQALVDFQTESNYESLGAVCHKMKPNIQMLGNNDVYNNLVQIEMDAKNLENIHSLPERVQLLILDLKDLLIELK